MMRILLFLACIVISQSVYANEEHAHEHEEEHKTELSQDAAKQAGIRIEKASPAKIADMLTLTGRIVLNRNTTSQVRARFAGLVKEVPAQWGQHVQEGDTLAVIEANESLRHYSVTAPMDGVVLARNTNPGNVAGDEPLFTLADLSNVWAEFHVFSRDITKVNQQQHVHVRALEKKMEVKAPITLILPTADPLSQTVIAIVSIPNPDGTWRPGMSVEGDVHLSDKNVPVAVSPEAIQRMDGKTVVFVKEGDAYHPREVTLGLQSKQSVEIKSGLAAGEAYVSQGSFIIKADIGKAAAKHEH